MKRDISDFLTICMVCQRVKAKHQVLSRLLQLIRNPSGNGTESQWILWSGYH